MSALRQFWGNLAHILDRISLLFHETMPDKSSSITLEEAQILLTQSGWLADLPEPFQRCLLEEGRLIQCQKGDAVLRRGQLPDGIYGLVTGSLKASGMNAEGREIILTFLEAPEWFGEISVFDRLDATHDVYALTPATLFQVPRARLQQVLERHPALWQHLGELMARKIRWVFMAVEQLIQLPIRTRLVRRLLMLAYNDGKPIQSLPYSQEQLGATIGLTRQTTNQILKELETQGAIRIDYGKVQILDLDRLERFSDIEQ